MCAQVGGVLFSQALMSGANCRGCKVFGRALMPINKLHALSYRPPIQKEMGRIRAVEMGFKWSCSTLDGTMATKANQLPYRRLITN